ncbi:hypothetical protein D3C75_1202000 [compost metagenome]
MDESDVPRRDAGFDQQAFVHRHDLHHLASGLHHATQGVDLDVLDDAAHRRAQGQAGERVAAPADHFRQGVRFGAGLGQFFPGAHQIV